MNLKLQINEEASAQELFHKADDLREEALEKLRQAEEFYIDIFKRFPDECNFNLTHQRGRVEGMLWQVRQLAAMSSPFYSQAGQDRYLDSYVFNGKKNGVFVEVGGYDGISGSNCLFFETIRNWSGIMIEPSPVQMEHARLLRSCACIEVAIGAEEGEADFINVTSGMTQMSGLKDAYGDVALNTIRSYPEHKEEMIRVPVQRLDKILKSHGLRDIDFCSLDVEGSETRILSTFPFRDFNISIWCIENYNQNTEILEIMMDNGYQFVTVIGVDEIYQKADRQV